MSLALELAEWVTRTADLHTVEDVLAGRWTPPTKVRILCLRGRRFVQSEEVLSLSVEWHRLDLQDFVEPA